MLVSTSGGAIRSATWTTRVFVELDQQMPGFHRQVRLITGASGGTAFSTIPLDLHVAG